MQAMEARERVLGLEDPDTLNSMCSLACTHWSLGRRKEAIELMSEVVQFDEKKFGPDHPTTVESIRALQQWHQWQDRKKGKHSFSWFRNLRKSK